MTLGVEVKLQIGHRAELGALSHSKTCVRLACVSSVATYKVLKILPFINTSPSSPSLPPSPSFSDGWRR